MTRFRKSSPLKSQKIRPVSLLLQLHNLQRQLPIRLAAHMTGTSPTHAHTNRQTVLQKRASAACSHISGVWVGLTCGTGIYFNKMTYLKESDCESWKTLFFFKPKPNKSYKFQTQCGFARIKIQFTSIYDSFLKAMGEKLWKLLRKKSIRRLPAENLENAI